MWGRAGPAQWDVGIVLSNCALALSYRIQTAAQLQTGCPAEGTSALCTSRNSRTAARGEPNAGASDFLRPGPLMPTRRDFLRQGGSAAALALAGGTLLPLLDGRSALGAAPVYPRGINAFEELPIRELLAAAIEAARSAGASFSDARIGRYRQNFVVTREKQIINVVDTDSIGIGIRALVNGAWGFAASQNLTMDGVAAAAREAAAIAKANAIPGAAPVVLAPAEAYPNATWKSAYTIDPFAIPVEQKADLLIKANA